MRKASYRIASVILAGLMLIPAAGCKKSKADSSSSEEVIVEYVDENGNPITSDANSSTDQGSGSNTSKTTSGSSKDKATNTINNGVNPADYAGTKIVFATWRDPKLYEDGSVVTKFKKKYKIDVQVDVIAEDNYTQTILGRIASGDAPDVFFSTYTFPYCLSALQPIDAAKLNLDEPVWDQTIRKLSTVNGKTYLVNTVGNIQGDRDMVFYNKKLLKQNKITTPDEYINAGKWTFDAMKKIMQSVAGLGTKYVGGAVNMQGLVNSTGASFMRFNNGKFESGMDSHLNEVVQWLADGVKGGYIKGLSVMSALNFKNGNYGLVVSHAFGLKANGHFRDMNPDDIGFAPIPDWNESTKAVPSTFMRGWGLCKGAKNPVAAGIFLRYYLDVDNYDTSSAFLNDEAESFFFKLTSSNLSDTNIYWLYGQGVKAVTGTETEVYKNLAEQDPGQVAAKASELKNTMNSDVNKLNDYLSKVS